MAPMAAQSVRVEVTLPGPIAEWLEVQAALRFEPRGRFLRHLIVTYYLYAMRAL